MKQKIVSRDEWVKARKRLLAKEKDLTHRRDALNVERRKLPVVEIAKDYVFEGPAGKATLRDLFEGRDQLIVYHFMFEPGPPPPGRTAPWTEGCPGCSFFADQIPSQLEHLHARDTTLVMVSRAPMEKIAPFKRRMGWTMPWYSSFGSDFNVDFHVTLDESKAPIEYNYRSKAEIEKEGKADETLGELPGLSVFLRDGDRIFHSYSAYARGLEAPLATTHLLDLTPFGRGEGWDGMPDLFGQGLRWVRHHDRYGDVERSGSGRGA